MSKKCRAYSESKFGLQPADNRKAFYAGWDAALKERLAQPVQEPVAWMNPSWIDSDTRGWASDSFESIEIEGWIPLYTSPRQWKGLTDEEIMEPWPFENRVDFARSVEAKLKEKNNGH